MAPALGSPHLHLRLTTSTNERARELAARGAPHGTLVTAAEQSAGRRSAGTPLVGARRPRAAALRDRAGSAARPAPARRGTGRRPSRRSGSAAQVAQRCTSAGTPRTPPRCARSRASSPRAAPRRAGPSSGSASTSRCDWRTCRTSCMRAPRRWGSRRPICPACATRSSSELERSLAFASDALLDRWRERDALLGRQVRWSGGDGVAAGIDGAGRLIVELHGGGRTELDAGEVHLVSG